MYCRSRIKCLLFMPKIPLKRVCGMVKNGAHTILKIKKRKVPQIFCFFSMVWGDLEVTRPRCKSFGHEKRTFYSATVTSENTVSAGMILLLSFYHRYLLQHILQCRHSLILPYLLRDKLAFFRCSPSILVLF